jgi:hypothetical protein
VPVVGEDIEPVVLNFSRDVKVTRTATTTTVEVVIGKYVRTPNADANLSITRKDDEYTIQLGFLGKDLFEEKVYWEWTGNEFSYDNVRKELVFKTKRLSCPNDHIFHLEGPSVFDHAADSMTPNYKVQISLRDGAAIVSERGGRALFKGGLNLSGTYLSGYGVKLDPIADFSDIWAGPNAHPNPNPDPSWDCPRCGSNLWLGAQCRMCGLLSDPADV